MFGPNAVDNTIKPKDLIVPVLDATSRFSLGRPLGEGGMGTVIEALDTKLDRRVAIKVMHESLFDEERLKRFDREARAMAKLSHPNICQIYDFASDAVPPYLVMEYIEGVTLKQRAKQIRCARLNCDRIRCQINAVGILAC